MNRRLQGVLGVGMFIMVGCGHGVSNLEGEGHMADPVLDMLHRGILDLEENVTELDERIAELEHLPPVPDAAVQELRALDLSGWQLHQRQWFVQRERLLYAVHQIQQAQAQSSKRGDLWAEWTGRQQEFLTALEDLRAQRHGLERKRLSVESELLKRYFQ